MSNMRSTTIEIAQGLRAAAYLQERLEPQPGDSDYLHLADLRAALETCRSESMLRILDYGCGGSPYQALFPQAEYCRADYYDDTGLDYIIDSDGRIQENAESFDLVLSTQVAEHVSRPASYFAECYRLLRPGGRFICSTHGSYIDHGCPNDFQRWTADGLLRDLKAAGFQVKQMAKLTTGPRALVYFVDRFQDWLAVSRTTPFGLVLWGVRGLINRFRRSLHVQCDRHFDDHRVVVNRLSAPEHALYIVLFVVAERPQR